MLITSMLKKGLFAATAAATLLLALPSQAGQPYCPPPHGDHHDHRGDYRYGRPPVRKVVVVQRRHHHGDRRDDRRWDHHHGRHDDRWNRYDDDRYDRRYPR